MKKFIKIIICTIILLLIVSTFCSLYLNFNDAVYTVTITQKESVTDNNNHMYLIFAKDKYGNSLVFKNTDSLLRGKNNSSNVYIDLQEGHTYKLTTIGARIPIFSMYENIIDYSEIS